MPTIINIFYTTSLLFMLSACSAKEINKGVDSITSDITDAFESSRDKSAD